MAALRELLPVTATLGVSGDAFTVDGLRVGGGVWYSPLTGRVPDGEPPRLVD